MKKFKGRKKFTFKHFGLLVLILFIVLSIIFAIFGIKGNFLSQVLLAVLEIPFQSIMFFAIGYYFGKNYVNTGLLQLLLIGVGMVALAIGVLITSMATLLRVSGAEWVNYGTTTLVTTLLIFSVCNFLASISAGYTRITHDAKSSKLRRKLFLTYIIVAILVALFCFLAILGGTPHFVDAGKYTLLEQLVSLAAILLFISSSIVFCRFYFESKSRVLYWYLLGLGLYAVGLFSVNQATLGTPLAWLGQVAQYVGSVFFLVALVTALSSSSGADDLVDAFKRYRPKLEALFSNMREGFAYLKRICKDDKKHEKYEYVFVNDAFLKILGLSKQISRKELFACLPEALNEVGMTSVFERVSLTGVHESIEKFLVDRKIWVLASVYSIEKGYFAVLLEDITERKQVEENLKSYSKELEFLVEERTKKLKDSERLAAIGETAGMVGHDIRNPLQAITGDLYLLKEEFESLSKSENGKSIQESIKAIEDNVFYINKIVSDLQDYTRTLKPSIQEVYLRSLINSILLNASIPNLIKTIAKIQEGLILNTDPDYLRRALTNIITNAYQAMPNGGQLTLSAEKKENITVITVEDTGIGISPEIKSKLFTPLFTTKSKGQGLGLAVSKRLIEALNGDITVESKEGEGTKFVITLPA